jgi:transcriptional regulator with XRE-family HTH domain
MDLQRRRISEFLRSRRARLAPSDVGLPDTYRRRTPGLRREDVAVLAGVSVTWFTWLEQGRDIQVSVDVLERICSTLRLSDDEREYLFALVQRRPPPPLPARSDAVSPALARTLEGLGAPALVITLRWDVVGWNRLAKVVFRDYEALPLERRNLLRILLVDDPGYRADSRAYEAMARRVLAKFRIDYSRLAADPACDALIADLEEHSPMFRRLWDSDEVLGHSDAVVTHPQHDDLTFVHSSFIPEGNPTLRVMLFVPNDNRSAAKLQELAGF